MAAQWAAPALSTIAPDSRGEDPSRASDTILVQRTRKRWSVAKGWASRARREEGAYWWYATDEHFGPKVAEERAQRARAK